MSRSRRLRGHSYWAMQQSLSDPDAADALWFILRMAGPRTLSVTSALNDAGLEAWTPTAQVKRRHHRGGKAKVSFPSPIAPTFAFVRAEHLGAIRASIALPMSPYPPFSIFQHDGRIPVIRGWQIDGLRAEEAAMATKWAADQKAAAAQREKDKRDELRKRMTPGARVTVAAPAFVGLVGTVEGGNRKGAVIHFGGGMRMKIDTWLLAEDTVRKPPA